MADFPRIKWLNIDGQQVPFTEPQHFTGNGDETVRTGHDNPLPVANYTKKGNIWLPVSEENPVPTQVTGSIVEEIIYQKYIDIQPNSEVDIVNRFDLTGYRYIKYATWSMTHNDKIALRKRERVSEFVLSPFEEVLVVDDSLRSTEVMDIEGTQIDIKLVNKSDELITEIRVVVIGYKM